MSNSNLFQSYLSYVAETTAGTTPGSPSMLKLRTTDPLQITPEKEAMATDQPYSHRQATLQRHGFKSVGGNIPVELSYAAFDDWLEALLGGSWSTETAGTPQVLKLGNAINTFTVERGFSDIGQYEVFRGVIPNSMSLSINPQGIVTGQFGVIGMGHDVPTGTPLGSPTDVATNEPFDGLGNGSMQEGGSAIAIVTSVELNINNNRNIGRLIGSDEGEAPSNGQIEVTGTLAARFQDLTLLNKFYNETESSLQVVLNDQAGTESLTLDLHKVKYNGGGRAQDNNTLDVSLPFVGLYDSVNSTGLTATRSNS